MSKTTGEAAGIINNSTVNDFAREKFEIIHNRLKRSEGQFSSKIFIMLVFGPLKSGKSTLVNCLAGYEVSPTALGISSTKRPSIVIGADVEEPTAKQFYEANRSQAKRLERFEQVIDCLRGILPEKSIESEVVTRGLEFAAVPETLRKTLAASEKEPLLTAMQIPENDFLKSGMAIIDSPGLDDPAVRLSPGEKTAVEWAVGNADLCILVQSSLAAPNAEMLDFVTGVLTKHSTPPLLLVQNVFEAKLWRSEEARDKENNDKRRDTLDKIKFKLGDKGVKLIEYTLDVNLGLASDLKFHEKEIDQSKLVQLKIQDGLDDLKVKVHDLLEKQNQRIRELGCVNRLKELLKDAGEIDVILTEVAKDAEQVKRQYEDEHKRINDAISLLSKSKVGRSYWEDRLKSIVDDAGDEWRTAMRKEVQEIKNSVRAKYGDGKGFWPFSRIKSRKINPLIQNLNNSVRDGLRLDFDNDGVFGESLSGAINEIVFANAKDVMNQAQILMNEFGLDANVTIKQHDNEKLPEIESNEIAIDLVSKGWFEIIGIPSYNTDEIIQHLESEERKALKAGRDLRKSFHAEICRYVERCIDNAKMEIKSHLKREKLNHADLWKERLLSADEGLRLVGELRVLISPVKQAAFRFADGVKE